MNDHNFLTGIIKTVAGVNDPAQDFATVRLSEADYFTLRQRAYSLISNGKSGQHIIEAWVDYWEETYYLQVEIYITYDYDPDTGGSDDYGNYESIGISDYFVGVLDFRMIDGDLGGINCDFDTERFEKSFN